MRHSYFRGRRKHFLDAHYLFLLNMRQVVTATIIINIEENCSLIVPQDTCVTFIGSKALSKLWARWQVCPSWRARFLGVVM